MLKRGAGISPGSLSSVLVRKRKEGLGKAYVHGFQEALRRGYGRVVTMDADLSHAPEDVPRLLEALGDADVAIGSRHVEGGGVVGWPLGRRLLSRAGSLYARRLLDLPVRDVTSGFRAYRAEALSSLDWESFRSQGFVFQVEILRRLLDLDGARAVEIPIVFRNRTAGRSKLSSGIVLEAGAEAARLVRRRRPPSRRPSVPGGAQQRKPTPSPPVTVIVASRPGNGVPGSVKGLGCLSYPSEKLETVVVEGTAPSIQRNLGAKNAVGELLLFLDDDSLVSPELLSLYAACLAEDPGAGAVGGPARYVGDGLFARAASAALSDPWVMGRSASRYAARGGPRATDERELILCNLCVRRSAFESAGGFDERLYPNEENELLERLERGGWKLLYHPDALVHRPAPALPIELFEAMFRYGRGRSRQGRIARSTVTTRRRLLAFSAFAALVMATIGLLTGFWSLVLPAGLYGGYLVATGARLAVRSGARAGLLAALLVPLLQGSYAAGLLSAVLSSPPRSSKVARLGRDTGLETPGRRVR